MKTPIYQVDAFADEVFKGNPAAVCPLDHWLPDKTMQSIAAENNLAETAFFVARPGPGGAGDGPDFDLRWFSPEAEIDLCGHATLASAFVIFTTLDPRRESVTFHSRSGPLTVTRDGTWLTMDFPARPPAPCPAHAGLAEALGATPREVWKARDLMAVFESESQVLALAPSFDRLRALGVFGVIATAPGGDVDFVSRFFAPLMGVPEDPVTGSSHCTLVPYWARRLGKQTLLARQLSRRGGELRCEDRGERVTLSGRAVAFLEGHIEV